MASDKNAVRAGIVIVVATCLIVGGILGIAGLSRWETQRHYTAKFLLSDDIGGLRAGDDVRIGGFKVGAVTSVELVIADPAATATVSTTSIAPAATSGPIAKSALNSNTYVQVIFDIPARYVLMKGARVTVGGLIGTVFLNIDSVGTERPLTNGEPVIGAPGLMGNLATAVAAFQTEVVPKVSTAVQSFEETSREATAILKDAHARIDPINQKVDSVLAEAHTATTQASRAARNMGDLLGDNNPDGKATIASLRHSAESVEKAIPDLTSKASQLLDRLNNRLDALKATFNDLEQTMAAARSVSGDVRTLISDNRPRIDRIIANVNDTTANIKDLSAEIRHRPSRIIWRDDDKTTSNIQVYEASREFANGATELNDAATALKQAMASGTAEPQRIQELMRKLDESFSHFQDVEGKLYKSVKP